MKKISILILLLMMMATVTLLYQRSQRMQQMSPNSSIQSPATALSLATLARKTDRSIVSLQIADQPFSVEVVNSAESITLGLSGRSEIGHDGMLFVLPRRQVASFWMKDMLFDLDLVWIDGDTIVGVTANVPAPESGMPLTQLPSYSSTVPVTHVLEIPAGTAQEKGWSAGTPIML